MSEYVCELPSDGVASFGSGNTRIPVHERVTRCKRCMFSRPDDKYEDGRFCEMLRKYVSQTGFCYLGRTEYYRHA
jgi:hypothetical protein